MQDHAGFRVGQHCSGRGCGDAAEAGPGPGGPKQHQTHHGRVGKPVGEKASAEAQATGVDALATNGLPAPVLFSGNLGKHEGLKRPEIACYGPEDEIA